MKIDKPHMIIGNKKTISFEDIKKFALIHCVLDLTDTTHTISEHNILVNKFKDTDYKFEKNCPLCEMGSKMEGL